MIDIFYMMAREKVVGFDLRFFQRNFFMKKKLQFEDEVSDIVKKGSKDMIGRIF